MQKTLLILILLQFGGVLMAQPPISIEANATTKTLLRSDRVEEISVCYSADGGTLYYARDGAIFNFGKANAADIWQSDLGGIDQSWQEPVNMGPQLNTSEEESIISASGDGNSLYFTRKEQGSLVLYKTLKSGRKWSIPKPVSLPESSELLEIGHYFISADEQIMLLSGRTLNQPNGSLFFALKQGSNLWSEPRRLFLAGSQELEVKSAFLASDNRSLYFSTSSLGGYGANDLFVSRRLGRGWYNWSSPENLGPEINTPADEYGLSMPIEGRKIAYLSNVKKGEIKIFTGELPISLEPALESKVGQLSSADKEEIILKKSIKNK